MVMWTNTHFLNLFHVILYFVSICAKLQTSSASPSILINLFKVATPRYISIMWQRLLIIPIMCINTIQKQILGGGGINNQDTFLQLYHARNVNDILGK